MLTCNAQNRIHLRAIIDAVNANETDVAVAKTTAERADLASISNTVRIVTLEQANAGSTLPGLTLKVDALEIDNVSMNTDIGTNTNEIVLSNAAILALGLRIDATEDRLDANEAAITALQSALGGAATPLFETDATSLPSSTNKVLMTDDIATRMPTDLVRTATYLNKDKNFMTVEQRSPMNATGGASTAGSWELRALSAVVQDYIGGGVGLGSIITLPAGTYNVDGYAVGVGGYHQSRIYNQTDASVAILGSSQSGGNSLLQGTFTIAASSTFVLETQVDTSDANGHGEPNPFDEGVFSFIKFERIGV